MYTLLLLTLVHADDADLVADTQCPALPPIGVLTQRAVESEHGAVGFTVAAKSRRPL
jgi:hypothetical protein